MTDFSDIASTFSSHLSKVVERNLVEIIERRLGRVPSNEEVARHGHCFVGPQWTVYKWDDKLLFSYRVRLDGFKYVVDTIRILDGKL